MSDKLIVSSSPHIRTNESVARIMWMVFLSLLPAGAAGMIIYGHHAFFVICLGVISALLTELVLQVMTKRKITVLDGSAALTGLLLAYNLPPRIPFWIPIVGSVFAIAVGKQVFGGLGQNIFNPALVGRAFLMACWPRFLTVFPRPFTYDARTSATPLVLLKEGKSVSGFNPVDLLVGARGGCIGEVCIAALLVGALFLLARGYITWHIPFTYIGTTALMVFVFGGRGGFFRGDWLFHVLSGGLILGAFFMATDYVTSPLTLRGQLIFGFGCGVLTAVIRLWGGYPEGVSYAILMMNGATPIIDRYTKSRIYGTRKQ